MRVPSAGRLLLVPIEWYRQAISPLLPASCRYVPTCSAYAADAVERFGAARGGWLAVRRLARCHPLHRGGYDPVPDRVGHRGAARGVSLPDGSSAAPVHGRTGHGPAGVGIAHPRSAPERGSVQQVESYP